jgi:hypothetical protein
MSKFIILLERRKQKRGMEQRQESCGAGLELKVVG